MKKLKKNKCILTAIFFSGYIILFLIQGLPNDFEKRLLYHLPIELSIVVFNEKLFSTLEVNKNTDLDVLKLNKNLVYLNTHLLLY